MLYEANSWGACRGSTTSSCSAAACTRESKMQHCLSSCGGKLHLGKQQADQTEESSATTLAAWCMLEPRYLMQAGGPWHGSQR